MVVMDAEEVLKSVGKKVVIESEDGLVDLTALSHLIDSYTSLYNAIYKN